MGRETKILLGFLGLLAGVFMGVLSVKLLVPRPPTGAGPDIQAGAAFADSNELVEPPARSALPWDFTTAPPLVAAPAPVERPEETSPEALAAPAERFAAPPSRFGGARDGGFAPADAGWRLERREPEVVAPSPGGAAVVPAAAWQEPAGADAAVLQPESTPFPAPSSAPAAIRAVPVGGYVVRPGDSWWSVAEAAYGDGRLYRALFAWNKALTPRVSLEPGTMLEIPSADRLAAAWPRLLPADR